MSCSSKCVWISLTFIVCLSSFSYAQDYTANPGDGNWENATTWTPTGVPGDNDIILIPEGSSVWVTDDYSLNNAIMIVEGELVMSYTQTCIICFDYGSLTFTGSESGVILEDNATVTDNTWLERDQLLISVQENTFWSGDACRRNCGTQTGTFTSNGTTYEPQGLVNPLPVALLHFTATAQNKSVSLRWATASESNNSHFEIERSADGYTYERIGSHRGAGDSNDYREYQFIDSRLPVTRDHVIYYRLKQIDFDGQYEHSDIVAVQVKPFASQELTIYPNPFRSHFSVRFTSLTQGQATLSVVNMKGKQVFSRLIDVSPGINELDIDQVPNVPPGIYSVAIISNAIQVRETVEKGP